MATRILCVLFAVVLSFSAHADSPLVTVGVAVPLTGPAAFLGQGTQTGIELYLDEHPELRTRLKVRYEDVMANTAYGVTVVRKLLEQDRVDALVLEISTLCNAASPFIERLKVPTIAITGDAVARGKQFMVSLYLSPESEAAAVKEYLLQKNYRRVVFVTSQHDSMLSRAAALRAALYGSAVELQTEFLVLNADEAQSIATKTSSLKPDAVLLYGFPGVAPAVARALRRFGYKGQLVGTVVFADADERKAADGALEGAVYPDLALDKAFVEKFAARFGGRPKTGVPNGYDAMKILHAAFDAQGWNPNRRKTNELIRVKDFQGAMGSYAFASDGRNAFALPAVLRTVGGEAEAKK